MAGSFYQGYDEDGDAISGGVETLSRKQIASNAVPLTASGRCHFTYFTPKKSATITKMALLSGSTAAGATPTLCRVGFYTVASNGDVALACAIASDTALFAGTFTEYERSLSTGGGLPASYTFNAGQRYAAALIVVTGATLPTFYGNATQIAAMAGRAPKIATVITGQSDLPASVAAGSLANNSAAFHIIGVA